MKKDSGILSSLILFFGSLWCLRTGGWPFEILAALVCGWAALELLSLFWKDRDSTLVLIVGLGVIFLAYRDFRWLHSQSIALCFFPILLASAYDTLAMLVGKTFGRRIVAPGISPTKTYEGTAGGILAILVLGHCYDWAFLPDQLSHELIPILLAASLIAPLTDFGLSSLKRVLGVKDSCDRLAFGRWQLRLGRHGGVLDRVATHLLLIVTVTIESTGRFFFLP